MVHILAITLAVSFAATGPPKPTTNRTHRTFPLPKMAGHATTTGWLSSAMDKALLYDAAADGFRGK